MYGLHLREIVYQTEIGGKEESHQYLWLSVPGSLIYGKLVPFSIFIRSLSELTTSNIDDVNVAANVTVNSKDLIDLIDKESSIITRDDIETAHLVDVTIHISDSKVKTPHAVIRINTVGAWGMVLPEEFKQTES